MAASTVVHAAVYTTRDRSEEANSEMSGAGRHYSVTKVQGKGSLEGALCSFLLNKLHTKIWITCIQMCRILSRSSSRLLR